MNEIWKDIKGYEGKYQISDLGHIKSLNYNMTGEEKIMKRNESGCVILSKNGDKEVVNVFRLFREYFPL